LCFSKIAIQSLIMILSQLSEKIAELTEEQATGELIFHSQLLAWKLYIFNRQILYATDNLTPIRRWQRILSKHCLDVELNQQTASSLMWETQLLHQALNTGKLSLIQAKLTIRAAVRECLFELSGADIDKIDWQSAPASTEVPTNLALSSFEIQAITNKAEEMRLEWNATGFRKIFPCFAPYLKQKSTDLPFAAEYFQGNHSIWDISAQTGKSIVDIAKKLAPLAQKKVISFQKLSNSVSDSIKPAASCTKPSQETKQTIEFASIESATPSSTTATKSRSKQQALIACIDDSPVLALSLKKILEPAGYNTIHIEEPMRGFGQLIEHKPNLILLDLNMPNADGYSICKFLRDTPVFGKTPIIILTAQNTTIDRVRAKIAGATDFIGKPPKAQELLLAVNKYILRDCD
jgi:chemotaxis family two-component system response regulator PixG